MSSSFEPRSFWTPSRRLWAAILLWPGVTLLLELGGIFGLSAWVPNQDFALTVAGGTFFACYVGGILLLFGYIRATYPGMGKQVVLCALAAVVYLYWMATCFFCAFPFGRTNLNF